MRAVTDVRARQSTHEREWKLAVPEGWQPAGLAQVLAGLPAGLVAAPLPARRLDAVYYDTPDLRLARGGVSVRYRSGDGTGWTVKLPDGPQGPALARRELVFAGAPGEVPDEVADLVRAFTRTAPLAPVARLRTDRAGVEVRVAGGEPVAEVVDDQVAVFHGRRIATRFREVEVETAPGAPRSLVDEVLHRLEEAGARANGAVPKVTRALGPSATAPPDVVAGEVGRRATTGELVQAALAASVARVIRHDPGVRIGDDPEDVHQARVGARRLRADLRTFADVLDPDWRAGLNDELRWLGAELGRVRDADVLGERLRARTADLPVDDGAGAAALLRRAGAERDAARATLLDTLRSDRYLMLLDALVAATRGPRLHAEAAGHRARDAGPGLLREAWRPLAKVARRAEEEPVPERLHELRILAKRCRYAAEALAPALGRPAARLAKRAAALQDTLGEHHDAVVAEAWLRAAAAEEGPAAALVAGELVTLEREAAAHAVETWPAAWDRAARAWRKLRDTFAV